MSAAPTPSTSPGPGTTDPTTWRVVWEIDIDAVDAVDAARQARAIQLRPASIATVFSVRPHGTDPAAASPVDLTELDSGQDATPPS